MDFETISEVSILSIYLSSPLSIHTMYLSMFHESDSFGGNQFRTGRVLDQNGINIKGQVRSKT